MLHLTLTFNLTDGKHTSWLNINILGWHRYVGGPVTICSPADPTPRYSFTGYTSGYVSFMDGL